MATVGTVDGGTAPSRFITLLGTQIPLLPDARPDLAYVVYFAEPNATMGSRGFTVNVPGSYYEVPLTVSFTYTTNGTAGSRQPQIAYVLGANGSIAAHSLVAQPASTSVAYDFALGQPTASTSLTVTAVNAPLLPVVVPSGFSWSLAVQGVVAGDTVSGIQLSSMRIPTGPNADTQQQNDPLAAPLLT